MASSSRGRTVLLSVRPRFAYAILDGVKHVELRRVAPAHDLDSVVLYATAPEQSVVGWFEVDGLDIAAPSTLWRRYGRTTSLTRREFDAYFDGCRRGVGIRVGAIHELPAQVPLSTLGNLVPPQGFAYLGDDALDVLRRRGCLDGCPTAAAAQWTARDLLLPTSALRQLNDRRTPLR